MRLKVLLKGMVVIMLLPMILTGCAKDRVTDVEIYKNTPAWELARAVKGQNVRKIARIAEETPEILDYQDPIHGVTLLYWAVGMEKYDSVEALLKGGADPNIISVYEGGTALYRAAGFSFIDLQAKKDPEYVKLLLDYGADPNIGNIGTEGNLGQIGTTPLMKSIDGGIEKTKALVEAGADIDYQTEGGDSAVLRALRNGSNRTIEGLQYAHYLIVEQQADVTRPWTLASGEEMPLAIILRRWIYEIGSERHKLKMEIVEAFAEQGEDYWATEISERELESIKRSYPDTWEEYIKVY